MTLVVGKTEDQMDPETAKLIIAHLEKMNFQPMSNNVLVMPMESFAADHVGVIEIPEAYRDLANRGVVVSVGPGKVEVVKTRIGTKRVRRQIRVKVTEVKPGDTVLLPYYEGTSVTVGGFSLILIKEDVILGKLEEENG